MIIWGIPQSEEQWSNLVFISINKDFWKKVKAEHSADTFYNKVIDEFPKKNWNDLQINFSNALFVDFISFSRNQLRSSSSPGYY